MTSDGRTCSRAIVSARTASEFAMNRSVIRLAIDSRSRIVGLAGLEQAETATARDDDRNPRRAPDESAQNVRPEEHPVHDRRTLSSNEPPETAQQPPPAEHIGKVFEPRRAKPAEPHRWTAIPLARSLEARGPGAARQQTIGWNIRLSRRVASSTSCVSVPPTSSVPIRNRTLTIAVAGSAAGAGISDTECTCAPHRYWKRLARDVDESGFPEPAFDLVVRVLPLIRAASTNRRCPASAIPDRG